MDYPFLCSLLIVAILALSSALIGRCFAVAFQVQILSRRDPESQLACLFVGTGLLTLTSGWGTYLGMPAPQALRFTLILIAILAATAAVRGGIWNLICPPKQIGVLVLIGSCLLLRAGLCLYPLILDCSLSPYNDTFCYISVAEYLQTHDFITPVPLDPDRPTWGMAAGLQAISHRMGPIYLLAMMQAAAPTLSAFELFPAAMAWGTALNVAGAFLLARWSIGVPRFPALVGALLAAVAADSLTLSAGCGFFCQVYGTATLAFGLAVLSRLTPRVNWQAGNACLFGLCVAMQLSVYGELSPFLAIASLAWVIQNARRARSAHLARSFACLFLATVMAIVALGNIEILRVYRALGIMTQINGLGWHVPWPTVKFFKFALGAHTVDWLYAISSGGIKTVLLFGLTAITFLLGLVVVWQTRRRSLPLVFALLTFVGLVLWFRYRAHDPWTGELGQTFNLFKLCQWFFPFATAMKMAGLAVLFERIRRVSSHRAYASTLAAAMICLGVAAIHLPVQHEGSRKVLHRVWIEKGTPRPFEELPALRRRIDEIGPSSIFYVQDPAGAVNNSFIAYALNHYPFLNSWNHAGQVGAPWLCQDHFERCDAGTLLIQFGTPPFEKPAERLAFNYSVIDRSRPVIFAVSDAQSIAANLEGRNDYWARDKPLYLEIVSPRTSRAELVLRVVVDGAHRENNDPPFRIDGVTQWSMIPEHGEEESYLVNLRVLLPRGLSRIALRDTSKGRLSWRIRDAKLNELASSSP